MKTLIILLTLVCLSGCADTNRHGDNVAYITFTGGSRRFYANPDSIEILGGGYCVRFKDLDAGHKRLFCGEYTISYPK